MPATSHPSVKRILIVDDHPMLRAGLAELIRQESGLEASAQADSARAAIDLVTHQSFDIALLDISLPDKSGLELIKDIVALRPGLPLLVFSMHDETMYAERVLRAGARGYLMKREGGEKLLAAIRQVLGGQLYVSPAMSARILEAFSGRQSEHLGSPVQKLSDREFEVFQHIGLGTGTREIAEKLHLSVKTIEVHRANIKEKLGLKRSTELMRYAVRWVDSQSLP
jgi:DNA-binding NarL/FixJ family response regulator